MFDWKIGDRFLFIHPDGRWMTGKITDRKDRDFIYDHTEGNFDTNITSGDRVYRFYVTSLVAKTSIPNTKIARLLYV